MEISDEQWLAANLNPEGHRNLGRRLPALPSDEVQVRFTGACGAANLQQAFDFYRFVLLHMPKAEVGRYRVLDFGGGWGRIIRFFLREYSADRLALLDCLPDAVESARSLNPPFAVFHTNVNPPLPFEGMVADCCIAFSVFSHLSEAACEAWLRHLGELLVPGGTLIITTRGTEQIKQIRALHRRVRWSILSTLWRGKLNSHENDLVNLLPDPDTIERRYREGEFQFYPTGGGGNLTESFYGETWIPEGWMREQYRSLGFSRCEFYPEFAAVNQCVFVLVK